MRPLSEALNSHAYPRFLHRNRRLFRLFHEAVHLTTLRNWYVRRALRRLMADERLQETPPVVLDVGCGAGDHLYYASLLRKQAMFVGIDRAPNAVRLAQTHANDRMEFLCRDLQSSEPLPAADILLCVTVLQYVRDDRALVSKMRKALRPGGWLLLYVPVRNERILPAYRSIVDGSTSDYDAAQGRQRVYETAQVERLLNETGFEIERAERTYGSAGKLAFELHGLILHGLMHGSIGAKIASVFGLVLLPVVFILMVADFIGPVERGNGLLVLAR